MSFPVPPPFPFHSSLPSIGQHLDPVGGFRGPDYLPTNTWVDRNSGVIREFGGGSTGNWVDQSGLIRDNCGNYTGRYLDPLGVVRGR